MPFTTGLLAGSTLTVSTLYLTLLNAQSHRARQSAHLQHSTAQLAAITDPETPTAEALRRVQARELNKAYRVGAAPSEAEIAARGGLVEIAKERWNRELLAAWRWVNEVQWDGVRERGEQIVRGVVRGASKDS